MDDRELLLTEKKDKTFTALVRASSYLSAYGSYFSIILFSTASYKTSNCPQKSLFVNQKRKKQIKRPNIQSRK